MNTRKLYIAATCLTITFLATMANAQSRGYRQYPLPNSQWISPNAGATQMYSWGMQPQPLANPQFRQPQYYPTQPQYLPPQQWIQPNAGATQMYPSNIYPQRNFYYR